MTATVTVVVGNPKPQSRTLDVARRVAEVAATAGTDEYATLDIDLATVAGELFDWQSAPVRALVDQVTESQLAVIASPTYKATLHRPAEGVPRLVRARISSRRSRSCP